MHIYKLFIKKKKKIQSCLIVCWALDCFDFYLCVCLVCLIKVEQRSGNLYWVSCDLTSIGTCTANGRYPQQLYKTTKDIRDLYLDWLRGVIIWLEEERIFTMSMKGGKAKELLQLAPGAVQGTITFDLRANSLLWNSKSAGWLLLQVRHLTPVNCNKLLQILLE